MKRILSVTFFMLSFYLNAQYWTVQISKKDNESFPEDVRTFDSRNFILFKNAVYDFKIDGVKGNNQRIIDVKKDSITLTNFFNKRLAEIFNSTYDTITIHPSALQKLTLVEDRSLGLTSTKNLNNYYIRTIQDSLDYNFKILKKFIHKGDAVKTQVFPYLTAQGYDMVYENYGQLNFYRGVLPEQFVIEKDTVFKKATVGFPPFSNLDEIRGLALSLYTEVGPKKDTLKIKGVNINADPFFPFLALLSGGLLHTSDFSNQKYFISNTFVNGLNLSTTFGGDVEVNGVNISTQSYINRVDGFNLNGIISRTYEFNGVSISGLRNLSYKGRGVQIALFNNCEDFRGLQFGLWNKNGKRSLPFINWQFKE